MAKFQSLSKYGKVQAGLLIYQRSNTPNSGAMQKPFRVQNLYVSKGSGVDSVLECNVEDIKAGSRAVRSLENGTESISLYRIDPKDFYVDLNAPLGETEDES